MRTLMAAATSVLFIGTTAGYAAQNQVGPSAHPPFEVGIGGERFFPIRGDWFTDTLHQASANVRVILPFTPRRALSESTHFYDGRSPDGTARLGLCSADALPVLKVGKYVRFRRVELPFDNLAGDDARFSP